MGNIPKAIYASRARSNTDSMNYAQLVAAANRLANVNVSSTTVSVQNTQGAIGKVDQANGATAESLQIATLNNDSIKELLNQ
jgi:hypothetical protein